MEGFALARVFCEYFSKALDRSSKTPRPSTDCIKLTHWFINHSCGSLLHVLALWFLLFCQWVEELRAHLIHLPCSSSFSAAACFSCSASATLTTVATAMEHEMQFNERKSVDTKGAGPGQSQISRHNIITHGGIIRPNAAIM